MSQRSLPIKGGRKYLQASRLWEDSTADLHYQYQASDSQDRRKQRCNTPFKEPWYLSRQQANRILYQHSRHPTFRRTQEDRQPTIPSYTYQYRVCPNFQRPARGSANCRKWVTFDQGGGYSEQATKVWEGEGVLIQDVPSKREVSNVSFSKELPYY